MKILFASITDSGILRVRSELINQLLMHGNEVVVVTPQDKDYQKLIDMGCRFIPLDIQRTGMNPFSDISVYNMYKKILQIERPNFVLLFTTKPNIYCGMACRKLNIPTVMNITGMGLALGKKGILQYLLVRMYSRACNGKNMKKIFFQNDDSLQFFRTHKIGKEDIYERIPGSGVNLDKFLFQEFPESDTVDFLFVARVMKEKGIDEYIEAARNIKKTHSNAVFHVLGECNEEYKTIVDEETKRGNIVYHGRVNNILDYEKISQCTIQPSYYPEGMSNVILEAAASGRPVITTDHPGCREGVDDGVSGFIVPIKDAKTLEQSIEKILAMTLEERKEMGKRGREKMEREFDRNIVTKAYLNVLSCL